MVTTASPEEISKKEQQENNQDNGQVSLGEMSGKEADGKSVMSNQEASGMESEKRVSKRINSKKLEEKSILRFRSENNLDQYYLVNDPKHVSNIGSDPISTVEPIFDAYTNTPSSEIFFEVRRVGFFPLIFRDRLYLMLSKLYHYREAKKTNVYLTLILSSVDEGDTDRGSRAITRIINDFQPAIGIGLLRVVQYNFEGEESQDLFDLVEESS